MDGKGPLWVEQTLDHLWDSPLDQAQSGIQALKTLGKVGLGMAKAIRERDFPDLSPPDWLEPPDDALYEFPATQPRVGVVLDHDARPWLDRIFDALPKLEGLAALTAWLTEPAAATPAIGHLIVHLGPQAVGTVPAPDCEAFRSVCDAAAARAEHPCVQALLGRREGDYLLQIGKPA